MKAYSPTKSRQIYTRLAPPVKENPKKYAPCDVGFRVAAALAGVDVIVFTAGIGENSPYIRREVLRPFGYLGLRIDEGKNQEGQTVFSCADSAVCAMRVPTDEELVIARDTCNLIPCKEDPTGRRGSGPGE